MRTPRRLFKEIRSLRSIASTVISDRRAGTNPRARTEAPETVTSASLRDPREPLAYGALNRTVSLGCRLTSFDRWQGCEPDH